MYADILKFIFYAFFTIDSYLKPKLHLNYFAKKKCIVSAKISNILLEIVAAY
jgi:hypothetical protein